MSVFQDSKECWSAGYERLVEETLRDRLRLVGSFGALVYLAFGALDFQIYPEFGAEFLTHRAIVSVMLVAIIAYTFVKNPRIKMIWLIDLLIALPTAGISWMIYRTDGSFSSYYQGLNLVLLAMVSANSFRFRHNLVMGGVVFAFYITACIVNPVKMTVTDLAPAFFFIGATLFFLLVMTRLYGHQHRQEYLKSVRLKETARELNMANQRLKATERLKDEFFANVSHELRTPLALVLGPARKLAKQEDLSPARRHDAAIIEKNAVTLLRHVNQLLDLSKLEAEKMAVDRSVVDLARAVRFVCSHFDGISGERSILFTVETPDSLSAAVDKEKFQRILFNLLSNAFKFVPSGGQIVVTLSTSEERVRLCVEDNGPGVPVEMRQAVFERFRQVDGGPSRRFGGTGLGLAIAAEFAKILGGDIGIEEAESGGAIFILMLPLVQLRDDGLAEEGVPDGDERSMLSLADEIRAEQPLAKPLEKVSPSAHSTVLVVEDNQEMGDFIMETLAPFAQVSLVKNGVEALHYTRWKRPDLIITDVMMPEMSGPELVKELRADPTLAEIPVLVLTAKMDQSLKTELLAQGVQDYLHKPFMADELVARANNLLALKRVREILERELERREKCLIGMIEEVAANKRTTEAALVAAEAAASAKDEFLMNLSHELRTPLTSILGWSEFLGTHDDTATAIRGEELREGMDAVHRNARSLLRLVNDLLDLSRVVQGKLSLDLKPTVISEPVVAAMEAVAVVAKAKGVHIIDLNENDDEDLQSVVMGDAERLQQVMWNLLSNAVKFTPAGGKIWIRAERTNHDITIEVSDTGQGISPEFLPHVFERLRQEDSSTKKRHAGLGLGLAIARHLVELHGGRIAAHSAGAGLGAVFTVSLPLTSATCQPGLLTRPVLLAKMERQFLHT